MTFDLAKTAHVVKPLDRLVSVKKDGIFLSRSAAIGQKSIDLAVTTTEEKPILPSRAAHPARL